MFHYTMTLGNNLTYLDVPTYDFECNIPIWLQKQPKKIHRHELPKKKKNGMAEGQKGKGGSIPGIKALDPM